MRRPKFHLADQAAFLIMAASSSQRECIEWPWVRTEGYGSHQTSMGRRTYTHRTILSLKLGRRLRSGELATHDCDNRGCVNGDHIRLGDHSSNAVEAFERGLIKPHPKEFCNHGHRLSETRRGKGKTARCHLCNLKYTQQWREKQRRRSL